MKTSLPDDAHPALCAPAEAVEKRSTSERRARVEKLATALTNGMFEREEVIAVALLGALSGQGVFLYGPPGTAKSLISRRIACAFESATYFECLMHRFTTPEDVFGPVSIQELKKDRYLRKTEGYLPAADFAFLDEIWKSGPAILNTLLTLVNERLFRNGTNVEHAPLKALIAASNETPAEGQGLEALYDRFVIRMLVGPIADPDHFETLISSSPAKATLEVPQALLVTDAEWDAWGIAIHDVQLSAETLLIIRLIRGTLAERYEELGVYVSDRRWQKAAGLMKAAAFFCDRTQTNHSDALLLMHCLWTNRDTREMVQEIVADAVRQAGFDSGVDIAELDRKKELLDAEIRKELYHTEHVYKVSKVIQGEDCYEVRFSSENRWYSPPPKAFIPLSRMKTSGAFHPFDEVGNELEEIGCEFDKQGVCKFTHHDRHYSHDELKVMPKTARPKILFHKGDKKTDVNERLSEAFVQEIEDIRLELEAASGLVEERLASLSAELASPFVAPEKTQIAYGGVVAQIDSLKQRIADCQRLGELCA